MEGRLGKSSVVNVKAVGESRPPFFLGIEKRGSGWYNLEKSCVMGMVKRETQS